MLALYSLGTFSISIVAYILLGGQTGQLDFHSTIQFFLFVVSARLVVGCLIPFFLGLFKAINLRNILLAEYALLVTLLALVGAGSGFRLPTFSLVTPDALTMVIVVAGAAIIFPLFRAQIKPLIETDSVLAFPYIQNWISRKTSTIDHAYGYSSLWECNLLPGFLLLKRGEACRGHITLSQLEPIIGMSLVLIDLCLRMQLNSALIALITIHFLSINIIWSWPTGAGTYKNDNAYAFGMACSAQTLLASFDQGATWLLLVQFACAALLASLKYSGFLLLPVISCLSLVFAVLLGNGTSVIDQIGLIAGAGLFCIAIAGAFPLRNYFKHGNPLYPVQIAFRGRTLAGTISPVKTSIYHALREPRLPGLLFGRHEFGGRQAWPVGILNFCAIVTAPAMILIMIIQILTPSFPQSQYHSIVTSAWAGTISLIAIYVWTKTVWSASRGNNDLAYLTQLWSVRYIIFAPLLLSVNILGFLQVMIGPYPTAANILIALIFTADLKLRFDASRWTWYGVRDKDLWQPLGLSLAVACALLLLPNLTNAALLVGLFVICLVVAQSYCDKLYGDNYRGTVFDPDFAEARRAIDEHAAANVFVIDSIFYANEPNWIGSCSAFVVGDRLQHNVISGSDLDFTKHVQKQNKTNFIIFAHVWTNREKLSILKEHLNFFIEANGFRRISANSAYTLFARDRSMAVIEKEEADCLGGEAVGVMPATLSIGRGRSEVIPRLGRWNPREQDKELTLTLPPVSLALSASELFDLAPAMRVAQPMPIVAQQETPWAIRGSDEVSVSVMEEDGTPFVRVTADAHCQWLAVIFFVHALGRTGPISMVAQVRSVGETAIALGSWDDAPDSPDGRYSDRNFGVLDRWTAITFPEIFKGYRGDERISINALNCAEGVGFDVKMCEILDAEVVRTVRVQ